MQFLLGIALTFAATWLGRFLFLSLFAEVEEQGALVVTRFGKLVHVHTKAGLVFMPSRWLPWTRVIPVSLQRDFRHYRDLRLNDRRGTSILIDLWIEFRIADPKKALFAVEDWEDSLYGLMTHSATSVLSSKEFATIMKERSELGRMLRDLVETETARWGLQVFSVYIRKVGLRTDVLRQMFEAVGARLETAKAEVEEEGRIRIGLLEARTAADIAALVAEAKSQHLSAIGRAYEKMRKEPKVMAAYSELHELSLADSKRLVSFQGFPEMRPLDAAMISSGITDGPIDEDFRTVPRRVVT
ncbi:MAG: SPFH domain-containing protein [Deltaproteobacteria bacterium]|nr:SPFH domain-containing protein [Deltaproteobacteria bacterium]MBI3295776.1 SPFH domain-containing protein [Deltaproteobacteria bacterium]